MIQLLSVLLLSTASFAKAPLEGVYLLTGNTASTPENHYYGSVTVEKDGTNYKLKWKIGTEQTQSGVAILANDVLSVGYYDDSGKDFGVVSYVVQSDKKMEGKWAPLGTPSAGKETLEFVGEDVPATWTKLAPKIHAAQAANYAKGHSIEDYENKYILETNADKKFDLLASIMQEYASGKLKDKKTARERAQALLTMAEEFKKDWNYGNAVHHSHLVLGRLSLLEGNKAKAKEYLKMAGETPGSPQLNSFGPNMTLAKELLTAGEKAAVLEYLGQVEKFWNSDNAKSDLAGWKKEIESGKTPNFGGNLQY